MSGRNTSTKPWPEEGSARGYARFERSWEAGSTSFCPDTQRRGPISSGSARPQVTGVGGVVVPSDRRAFTFSSDAGDGFRRLYECDRGLRGAASGSTRGPPLPTSSLAICKRHLPFRSSWRGPVWVGCRAWLSSGWLRRSRICSGPTVDPGHPWIHG